MTAPASPELPGPQGPLPYGPGAAPSFDPTSVPQGPGVAPLFVAPPTQRDTKRMWIGLGIGALVLVLCCAGGIVGFGVLIAGTQQETRIQARKTVTQYLQALKQSNYPAAYSMLCTDMRENEAYSRYVRRYDRNPIVEYSIGDVIESSTGMVVAATVDFQAEKGVARQYAVSGDATNMRVCGEG